MNKEMNEAEEKLGAQPLEFPTLLKVPFPFIFTFTHESISKVKVGLCPQSMDDHWGSHYTKNYIEIYRSWTGIPIYKIRLLKTKNGAYSLCGWLNIKTKMFLLHLLLYPIHILSAYLLVKTMLKEKEIKGHNQALH